MKWLKPTQTRESLLQRKIINYLKSHADIGFVRKLSDQFQLGIPDILFILKVKKNSYCIFFEVKTDRLGSKLSPNQLATINEINRSGGHAFVVRSVEDARKIVAKFSSSAP